MGIFSPKFLIGTCPWGIPSTFYGRLGRRPDSNIGMRFHLCLRVYENAATDFVMARRQL